MGIFLRPCLAALLLVFILNSKATKVLPVGGHRNSLWQIPSSPDFYNHWAQHKRFQIGDSIVFKYDGKTDSVVRVSVDDYKSCNASNGVQSYNDGNTRITLDRSGPFYFVSGAQGHCQSGQKLEVTVLSTKVKPASAPSPSPAHYAPAPAPNKSGAGNNKEGFVGCLAAACTIFAALLIN